MKKIGTRDLYLGLSVSNVSIVLTIAVFAFVASFRAVSEAAELYGVAPDLSWLVPCFIDGGILACGVSALRKTMAEKSCWSYRFGVFAFSLASVAANALHVIPLEEAWTAKNFWIPVAFAMAPALILACMIEGLIDQIKDSAEGIATREEVDAKEAQAQALRDQREMARIEREATAKALRLSKVQKLHASGNSPSQIASKVGVSRKTIERDLKEIQPAPLSIVA